MPLPQEGESQSDFLKRCIPYVIDEGVTDDPKRAAAICYSYWRKAHGGEPPKKSIAFADIDKIIIKYRDEELSVDDFFALFANVSQESVSRDAFIQIHWQDISTDEYEAFASGDKSLSDVLVGKSFCMKVRVIDEYGSMNTYIIVRDTVDDLLSVLTSDVIETDERDVLPSATEDDVAVALEYDSGDEEGSFWFAHDDGYDYLQLVWAGTVDVVEACEKSVKHCGIHYDE